MVAANIVDPIIFGCTLLFYLLYHVYLYYMIIKYPLKTASGQVWVSRQRWCEVMMEKGMIIEAVQTVRNSIMSTSVLATTSLALSSVVVALVGSIGFETALDRSALLKAPAINNGWRFFAVIVFFSCAFFSYMQSIRAGNHGSFLLAIPPVENSDDLSEEVTVGNYSVTPAYVAKVLNRGAMFFTIGTRFFYAAFLAVLWLWGPIPPLCAVILLVPVLFVIDRYPDPHYHKRKQFENVHMAEA